MTTCLAIETSCDETAVSILRSDAGSISIIAELIASQTSLHEQYGGVVPELASREHLSNLPILLEKSLENAGLHYGAIDVFAVTQGPGLKGCLLIGLGMAKGIAVACNRPLLGINHIEGHLHSPRIANPDLSYPYLALVVSGGHTEIVVVQGVGRYQVCARTKDDAAGEAFDKAANLLGLSYPGGAALAKLADQYRAEHGDLIPRELALPKVMRGASDFSFSGLKTAILLLVQREGERIREGARRAALAAAIQDSIVSALVARMEEVVRSSGIKNIAICGGVSANRLLRERLERIPGAVLYCPKSTHCMDNATMIGFVALDRYHQRVVKTTTVAAPLDVRSSWPVEELLV